MRDPARIRPMLEALANAWEASPDLRLGQLLENAREASGSHAPTFAIEDDVMLRGIVLLEERLAKAATGRRADVVEVAVIEPKQRHRLPDEWPPPLGHRLELVCNAAPASIAVDGMAPLEPQSFAFSTVGQHVTLEMMSTGYRVIAAGRSGTTGELEDGRSR